MLLSSYVVTNAGDPSRLVLGLTLRAAVADANAHPGPDTITFSKTAFAPGSLHTITLTRGELLLSDTSGATTITGPGASTLAISGNSISRIFDINSGVTANISGLMLTDGAGTPLSMYGNGGGAISNRGNLTVTSSTFAGNSVTEPATSVGDVAGGAIASGGSLTLKNCIFSGNSAYEPPNVVNSLVMGGAIWTSDQNLIIGCQFDGNSAIGSVGSDGGARGGAIEGGPLTITSCTFADNIAIGGRSDGIGTPGGDAFGGAIDGVATLTSCTISGNQAIGGNSRYYSGGRARGGGVSGVGSLAISGCQISDNTATAGNDSALITRTHPDPLYPAEGGGIYCDGTLTLTNSTVSGNTAVGGAATYQYSQGCLAKGGGIYAYGGTVNVAQSSITGNSATGGAGSPSHRAIIFVPAVFGGPGGDARGGGIYFSSSVSATITDSTIADNAATGGAGGSAAKGAPDGVTMAGTGGKASGGGIYSAFPFTLLDSTASGNVASGGAGGAGYTPTADSGLPPIAPGISGTAVGGGITSFSILKIATLIDNTIVSADMANGVFNDISASVSGSHNLIGVGGGLTNGVNGNHVGANNPGLLPLGNYGGPTLTMLPMVGSPVIDAGSNALIPAGLTTDQRGLPRIFGNSVDIGADEAIYLTLSGNVFKDINGDGIHQSNEPGLARWQVYLDLANTGVLTGGDPVAVTDSKGNYTLRFAPMSTKPLTLREVRQNNWRRTKPPGIYPQGFYTISPTAGSVMHLDFGNSTTALVSGDVFNDANSNGRQDLGEKGLVNVRVYVDLNKDGKFESNERSALTDAQGNWSIAGLAPGSYIFRVVQPHGYKPTAPANGVLSLTLTSGQTLTGKLFGEHAIG
jgi:fibronectin-binding autotransporter adhesin